MKRSNLFGRTAMGSAAFAVASFAMAAPAYAQPVETQTPPGTQAEEEAEAETGENVVSSADGSQSSESIVVTGSRIRLPNLEAAEPTTTLDRRQIDERNFTNVADALNELAIFRGSVTPNGAQAGFGQGVNFVNNYGLGSNRTLTLINGRRFVTSNLATNFGNAAAGTQTDLNVIPTILLDRIDTISIGGAPVYGSDAISGTVNVILRSRYDGIEVTGVTGITEEGDNFRYNASALVGGNLFDDRLNLTFAVAHDEVDGVLSVARDFLNEGVGNVTNINAAQAAARRFPGSEVANDGRLNRGIGLNENTTDLIPPNVLARGVTIPFLTRGGLISSTNLTGTGATAGTNPNDPSSFFNPATGSGVRTRNALQFDRDGNLVPFNQGVLFSGTSNAGGEGFRFQDFTQITSDLSRTILNGFITFALTPEIDLFAEGTYFESRGDELADQPSFNSSLFGGLSAPLTFSVNSPFLTPQARAELVRRGVTTFQVSRASADLSDQSGFNETEIYRGVIGVRGSVQAFGREFNYEAYYNNGVTESLDFRQEINAQNFINAVNVTTNAAGQIVCTTTPTVNATPGRTPIADPNCVPLDLLGEGRASAAARAYVIADVVTRSRNEQTVFNANIGGSFFDIWGGPVAFNIGYEYRKEEASFTPSQFQQQGLGRSVAITPLVGEYDLNEVFGEILLPLVSPDTDLSFLDSLQIYGRGRYVNNSLNGGFFSWAAGGSIAIIPDIEFRGNFTRSFRSPAITELFLPVVNAFSTVPDLCSVANRNGGAAPATRARNCAAFLAAFPNATPDPAGTATVPIQSGGNPNLDNEQADSYTLGVLLRPRFLPRFSATADYVNITLDGPISNLAVATITSGCFDNEEFNTADLFNANSFCSQIRRDPATGRVVNNPATPAVRSGFVNGVEIRFNGVQGTIDYSLPLSDLGLGGTFTIAADALYVRRRVNNITGVAPARTDGTLNDPEMSGQLRLRYVEESWGLNTTINYVGTQLFSRLNRVPGQPAQGIDAREIDELDEYLLVNAGLFFDAGRDFRLTLSVTNIFDYNGQEYFGSLIPASVVDPLGRRYGASARIRF